MSLRVGQEVVCIGLWPRKTLSEWWTEFWYPYEYPVKDRVYTVSHRYMAENDEMVELVELPSPATDHYAAGFYACGFRPVVKRKTDISIFTKMLTPKREDA